MNQSAANSLQVSDNAIVVRGGYSSASIIRKCCYQISLNEYGLAVVCGEKPLELLCQQILHDSVRSTTVSVIRKAGGDVVRTVGRNADSSILTGLHAFPEATGKTMNQQSNDMPSARSSDGNVPDGGTNGFPRVFADFHNADVLGRVRLNTRGTHEDFQPLNIVPHAGLTVWLYDGEQLSTEAEVVWDDLEGWVAEIDWSDLE